MKAPALYGAIALCVLACNRPDSALFGPDAPDGSGSAGTASSGGTAADGGSASRAGSASQGGGTDAGGSASGGASAGSAGEPTDEAGAAGQSTGGSEPPPPVCGNGKIEAGEECDDGGKAGMDGCDECRVDCSHFGSGAVESDDHHCYRGYDQATFDGAVAACEERGAHLVTITSAAENALVRGLVNRSKFIGGSEDVDPSQEGNGDYRWVTGEAIVYTNWARGEPNMGQIPCSEWGNQRCYEHCLLMNGQGSWEDGRCDQADGYACEWEPAGSIR